MKAFKKKSYVFLLSDFNDQFDVKSLRVVGNKHQLLGFGIYDEKDMQIPDIGYALLNDAETGEKKWVNTSSARWRYQFAEQQNKN